MLDFCILTSGCYLRNHILSCALYTNVIVKHLSSILALRSYSVTKCTPCINVAYPVFFLRTLRSQMHYLLKHILSCVFPTHTVSTNEAYLILCFSYSKIQQFFSYIHVLLSLSAVDPMLRHVLSCTLCAQSFLAYISLTREIIRNISACRACLFTYISVYVYKMLSEV